MQIDQESIHRSLPMPWGDGAISPQDLDRFQQAASQYRATLIWAAYRVTHNREDAEDIVQISLLKAYRNLHRFRGDAKLSTWLRAIVHNGVRDYLRRRKEIRFVHLDASADQDDRLAVHDWPDPAPDPEEQFLLAESRALLRYAIEKLDSYSKPVIEMCALDEISLRTAAQELQLSIPAIKSRILRGKRSIARCMTGQD